jgi:threonine synthase
VKSLFHDALNSAGRFEISAEEFQRIAGFGFISGRSTHADRLATIRRCFEQYGVMIDTHTADGLKVALQQRTPGTTMLVLETALPAKFAETIREALGREPVRPAGLEGIEAQPKRFVVMPVDVARVKAFITEHC